MARTAVLAIRVISDATKAARDLGQLEGSTSKLERAQQKATKAARAVGVGILAVGGYALKQASEVQQAAGAVDAVFGNSSRKVHQLAKDAAATVGLAQSEYSNLAATLGSQLKNMGVAQDQLVGKTDNLVKLGGDLAATFGGTTADAVGALGALLRGEADPIERYGVSIKDADIKARLAAKGQDKLTGAAAKTARTQAILELLNKQTAAAQGQRAREAGSAAQAQEIAMAKVKNAAASLGAILLPIFAAVVARAASMAGWIEKNRTAFQLLLGVAAGLAAGVYAVNGAIAAYTAITKVARAAVIVFRNAQLALNIAMAANPIGLVVVAVIALIAGIVLAYKRSEKFRTIVRAAGQAAVGAFRAVVTWVQSVVTWVKTKAPAAVAAMKTAFVTYLRLATAPIRTAVSVVSSLVTWVKTNLPNAVAWAKTKAVNAFNAITAPIQSALSYVKDLVAWIKKIRVPSLGGLGSAIGGVFGFASGGTQARGFASMSSPTTARSLTGGLALTAGGGGGLARSLTGGPMVQITVNGALDPDAVARQIQKLLGARARRIGA